MSEKIEWTGDRDDCAIKWRGMKAAIWRAAANDTHLNVWGPRGNNIFFAQILTPHIAHPVVARGICEAVMRAKHGEGGDK